MLADKKGLLYVLFGLYQKEAVDPWCQFIANNKKKQKIKKTDRVFLPLSQLVQRPWGDDDCCRRSRESIAPPPGTRTFRRQNKKVRTARDANRRTSRTSLHGMTWAFSLGNESTAGGASPSPVGSIIPGDRLNPLPKVPVCGSDSCCSRTRVADSGMRKDGDGEQEVHSSGARPRDPLVGVWKVVPE